MSSLASGQSLGKISKTEEWSTGIIQIECKEETVWEKKQIILKQWDNIKHSKIYAIGVQNNRTEWGK